MICLNSAGSPARSQVDRGSSLSGERRTFSRRAIEMKAPQADEIPAIAGIDGPAARRASLGTVGRNPSGGRALPAECCLSVGREPPSDRPAGSALETTEDRCSPTTSNAPGKSQAIASKPTLRRTWSGECSRPQCAFEVSMIYVFCNSH